MRKHKTKTNIMRLACVFALACLLISLFSPVLSAASNVGTGLSWNLKDGVLTISGNGAMTNFSEGVPAPWYDVREDIRVINIESGVTSIGNLAFWGCSNVTAVNMASTVKTIRYYAFYECSSLKIVNLSTGLTTIGEGVFELCTALQTVRLPSSLEKIGARAFYRCTALQAITIPKYVTKIDSQAFAYCENLRTATVEAALKTLPPSIFYRCYELTTVKLSSTTSGAENDAFSHCEKLGTVYVGSASAGNQLFEDIKQSLPEVPDSIIVNKTPSSTTEVTSSISKAEDNKIITQNTTVKETNNAVISTVVTNQITRDDDGNKTDQAINVQIDAIIEGLEGWGDLLNQLEKGEKENLGDETININVGLTGNQTISSETLGDLAGKNVDVTIDMKDGSTVKIDCDKIDKNASEKVQEYTLTHTVATNENPTKAQQKEFGGARSYTLTFNGSANFAFSPRIYLGKSESGSVATLYQEAALMGLKKLQSVVVDSDGYASFYLGSTRDTTAYIIAMNVEGVTKDEAIIPEAMYPTLGEAFVEYNPIEYVTTGVRLFMGLNIFQFSLVIFGSTLLLFLLVAGFMYPAYRKKRLEAMYQMKYGKKI